jgi:hypothetical protein
MAGVSKRRQPRLDSTQRATATITQASFMVGIYAEIVAMDQTIIERVRQLVVGQSRDDDKEAYLSNLRLVLGQLQRVGERLAFWNGRVRELVESELQ